MTDFFYLRMLALSVIFGGGWLILFLALSDPSSVVRRFWARYVHSLNRRMHQLFLPIRGELIARLQGALSLILLFASVQTGALVWFAAALLSLPIPTLYLEYLRRKRLDEIESKLDSFVLTLANTLKTTPSVAHALMVAEPMIPAPLDQEVGLALKELRLGSSLEQALLNMSARVKSLPLDAALLGVLIGRQVGGKLPNILETTAATLREIGRLRGVVRSKTAEGKAQLFVLALFPGFIVFAFDLMQPGYFNPLTETAFGLLVVAVASALWIGSILTARKVLAVDV